MNWTWWGNTPRDLGVIRQLEVVATTLRCYGHRELALRVSRVVKRGQVGVQDKPVLAGVLSELDILREAAIPDYEAALTAVQHIRRFNEQTRALRAIPGWARKEKLDMIAKWLREVVTGLEPQIVEAPVWLERARGHYLHWSAECETVQGDVEQVDPTDHALVRRCGRCRTRGWTSGSGYPTSSQGTGRLTIWSSGMHM